MFDQFSSVYSAKVSTSEFNRLSQYINVKYGIKLPPEKRVLVQSRLHKRLRELNLTSFEEYLNYLFSKKNNSEEEVQMMNVISTNKTEFFRESTHFDFLRSSILPDMLNGRNGAEGLNIWSAGCSSGEEVYTIAMVLEEFFRTTGTVRTYYSILGTDLSTKVLGEAVDAVYTGNKAAGVPAELKKRYFLKSRKAGVDLLRVAPEIRNRVRFQRLNFMDKSYNLKIKFDIAFCRNVLIYFESDVQEAVINKICEFIKPGGYLFLGHSESISRLNVPLTQVRSALFQRH